MLDELTMSQVSLFTKYAYFRLDDARMERELMAVSSGGGDVRKYQKERRPLRETYARAAEARTDEPAAAGKKLPKGLYTEPKREIAADHSGASSSEEFMAMARGAKVRLGDLGA